MSQDCGGLECSYACRMTWKGASCYCPEGKQAVGERCVDANECAEDDTCDQSCTNLPGTYKCGCMPGSYLHFQQSYILT